MFVRASVRQERRVAKQVGGRVQPGSGNQWSAKGDVKTAEHLIECKTTDGKGYRLTVEVLRKIETEAAKAGRRPVLQVEFRLERRRYAVIPWEEFLAWSA